VAGSPQDVVDEAQRWRQDVQHLPRPVVRYSVEEPGEVGRRAGQAKLSEPQVFLRDVRGSTRCLPLAGLRLRDFERSLATLGAATLGAVPCVFRWGDQVGLDLLDRLAVRAAPEHGVQHVVGDDGRPAAVLALAGRRVESCSLTRCSSSSGTA
jgi:hypothetical protein